MEQSLPDLLPFPETPYEIYERPPLVLALCQVRFPAVLSVADQAFVAPFQSAIGARYPIPSKRVEMQVPIAGGVGVEPARETRWQFSDREDNWSVVLAPDFVALETRAYQRFTDFVGRLEDILAATAETVRPVQWTRAGLRYINEIRPVEENLTGTIRNELLGPLAVPGLARRADTVQATQAMVLRYPGGLGVRITHGLFSDGTTVQPRRAEEPPSGAFYLLDFDAFREVASEESLPLDAESICVQVEEFNRAIYRLFRWSVTEQFTASLGVLDAG